VLEYISSILITKRFVNLFLEMLCVCKIPIAKNTKKQKTNNKQNAKEELLVVEL
jgi:hypothetical protein